jgi:hypothetical protein
MLLRLIFFSVNTGLSSALFAFLSVILVRLDTLLTQRFQVPNSLLLPVAVRHISDRSHLHRPV